MVIGMDIVYTMKTIEMKKIAFIAILLLILGLAFSSQSVTEKKVDTPIEDTIVEEDLQVEDWMTKPFTAFNS
jgi:hypothetical protein